MKKFYENFADQNVAATAIYKKASDTKAYTDAEFTNQFTTSELKNAFIKGALVILPSGAMVRPNGFSIAEGIGTLTYVENDSGFSEGSLVSKADE